MTRFLAFIVGFAALPIVFAPQQARGTISGITVNAKSTDPLGLVAITLIPLDPPLTPASPAPAVSNSPATGRGGAGRGGTNAITLTESRTLSASSDGSGNFQFSKVPPGRYRISAAHDGFFRQERFQLGYSGRQESILTVADGQTLEQLIVALEEVPPISGIVYGVDGERLAAAVVQAYKLEYTPYGRQLQLAASDLSHEGGEYRLSHLVPGNYVVSAGYSEQAQLPWRSKLIFTPNLSNPDEGYSTVFYPGELEVANARWINLSNPRDAGNVDVRFRESEYYRLSVKVTLPPRAPTLSGCPCLRNPRVALLPVGSDLDTALDYRIRGAGTEYSIDRLAKGDYVLVVVADVDDGEQRSVTRIVSDTQLLKFTRDTQVAIDAQHLIDIRGSIAQAGPGRFPEGLRIQLVRVDQLSTQSILANVDTGGSFLLTDVGPGTYDVFVRGMPASAYLRDAGLTIAGRQAMQVRIDASMPAREWNVSPDGKNAQLVSISRMSASVDLNGATAIGHAIDGQRKDFSGAQIVLVPSAASRTRKDRYYVSTSDESGSFQIRGIAPGAYTAFAFQDIEPGIYFDPDFNVRVAPRGTRVNIGIGQGSPIDLTVVTTEELARYIQ